MREYSYQITDASVEALRLLRAPWRTMLVEEDAVTVTTMASDSVRITVERTDVEPQLEALRLRAEMVPLAQETAPGHDIGDLGVGRNDVVLFNGESWIEAVPDDAGGAVQSLQFTGRAGQRSATAVAVCTATDAVVVAAETGDGLLIRTGVKPGSLDVVTDRVAIARFLIARGYSAG